MTTYINLLGGPGAGKSTIAYGLVYTMNISGISAELVPEFAKDLVWEKRHKTLDIQPYVSMKQFRNLKRLDGQVDYVVTDGCILKDAIYAKMYAPELEQSYYDLLLSLHKQLGNSINILLERKHAYSTTGRLQNEQEADSIHNSIKSYLSQNNINYISCTSNLDDVLSVLGLR